MEDESEQVPVVHTSLQHPEVKTEVKAEVQGMDDRVFDLPDWPRHCNIILDFYIMTLH